MKIASLTALALASAIAFSPLPGLQAAAFVSPGSQPGTEKLSQAVKSKKAKGAGSCGTNMYYSSKTGKCEDARTKK
jgi:hemolysin activation/secretion protein